MKRVAAIFIVSFLMLFNLKPIAYAFNTTQAKSRFVLFCMASKNNQPAACPHKTCPLMDKNQIVKKSEQSCDTRIECSTTHHQETAPSFAVSSDVYIPNICFANDYEQSSIFNLQSSILSPQPLALSIDKPPQNIA